MGIGWLLGAANRAHDADTIAQGGLSMSINKSIDTDPQLQEAASPQMVVVRSFLRWASQRPVPAVRSVPEDPKDGTKSQTGSFVQQLDDFFIALL